MLLRLQEAMTFCGDREDVVSMAATAVLRLLEAAGVPLTDIGKCVQQAASDSIIGNRTCSAGLKQPFAHGQHVSNLLQVQSTMAVGTDADLHAAITHFLKVT
jgi:3-hydroxy-3-methylglutaryl CoA synthase